MKRLLLALALGGTLTACGSSGTYVDDSSKSTSGTEVSSTHVQLIDGVPCIIVYGGVIGQSGVAISCDWSHYGGNQ